MGYEYEFRGVKVRFPFDAYECQKVFMRRVIHSLQEEVNALLESPTGTGKTLCLLCATLAWREAWAVKNRISPVRTAARNTNLGAADAFEHEMNLHQNQSSGPPSKLPTIVYASRTHTQLQQVVKELKRSGYQCKLSVLGSRDQMCIHNDVSKLSGSTLTAACQLKVKHGKCHLRNKLAKFNWQWTRDNDCFRSEILDIEELVALGKEHQICPYFYSRKCHEDADMILLPYNYLIDPSIRKTMNIVLQDAILLIDEAHNIEDVCSSAYSFDLTSTQLANAITEVIDARDILDKDPAEDYDISDFERLQITLQNFEDKLIELKIPPDGLTKSGTFIRKVFSEMGVADQEEKKMFLAQIDKCVEVLTAANKTEGRGSLGLKQFADAINVAFQDDCDESYRVHVHKAVDKSKSKDPFGGSDDKITISLWCFNAGIAMEKLEKSGVRSMILTSGTLSPMDSFATLLKVPFPIRLENKHVIHDNQVWIGVVDRGPCGQKLCSNFKSRNNVAYQEDLGKALVNVFRMVPNGVLVFFPSYIVMQLFADTWRNVGLLERLNGIKPVVIEKRGMSSMKESMEEFDSKVGQLKGCALFAVMRGKLSEGMDFADKSARAVCIIGVPYPPFRDPKVVLKKNYLDQQYLKKKKGLSGNQWYEQQASRATNQAIGRIVRHRNDYGAIIFLDYRFNQPRIKNSISAWLRSGMRRLSDFGPINRELRTFFKETQLNYDHHLKQVPANPPIKDNGETAVRVCTRAERRIKHITLKYQKNTKAKEESNIYDVLMTAPGTTLSVDQVGTTNPPRYREHKKTTLAKILDQSWEDFTEVVHQLKDDVTTKNIWTETQSQSSSQSSVMVTLPKNKKESLWAQGVARRREKERKQKKIEAARRASLKSQKQKEGKVITEKKKAKHEKLNVKLCEDLKNELSPNEYKVFKNCLKVLLRHRKTGMKNEVFIKDFFLDLESILRKTQKRRAFFVRMEIFIPKRLLNLYRRSYEPLINIKTTVNNVASTSGHSRMKGQSANNLGRRSVVGGGSLEVSSLPNSNYVSGNPSSLNLEKSKKIEKNIVGREQDPLKRRHSSVDGNESRLSKKRMRTDDRLANTRNKASHSHFKVFNKLLKSIPGNFDIRMRKPIKEISKNKQNPELLKLNFRECRNLFEEAARRSENPETMLKRLIDSFRAVLPEKLRSYAI